jgi:hypothetical protein
VVDDRRCGVDEVVEVGGGEGVDFEEVAVLQEPLRWAPMSAVRSSRWSSATISLGHRPILSTNPDAQTTFVRGPIVAQTARNHPSDTLHVKKLNNAKSAGNKGHSCRTS